MSGAEAFTEEASAALSTYLDELFEGVFHDNIATAGKTLTFLSLATYGYQRLHKSVLGQSDLSYSLSAHLRLAYERAILFTNTDFSPKLSALLEHGREEEVTAKTAAAASPFSQSLAAAPPVASGRSAPQSGRSSPAIAPASTPAAREGLLPIDAIKATLQKSGLLSKEQKIAAWSNIRRMSLAYFLVVTQMRVLFITACTIRNALLVLMHIEDTEAAKKVKAQSPDAASRWSLLKRFVKNRNEGKGSGDLMLEMMMSQALGALGGSSMPSASPFAADGPEGICSPAALVDVVLEATEEVTAAALRVVDATLTETDPVDKGECDEDEMSILLEDIYGA